MRHAPGHWGFYTRTGLTGLTEEENAENDLTSFSTGLVQPNFPSQPSNFSTFQLINQSPPQVFHFFPPLLVFSPTTVIIQAGNIIIETTLLSSQLLISSFLLRRFVGDNTNKGGKDTSQLCIYFR